MTMKEMTRRQLLKVSGTTVGGAALLTSPAVAFDITSLEEKLTQMIFINVEGSQDNEDLVRTFVKDLLTNKIDTLEDSGFIDQESKKLDQQKLERFVVIQFITSTSFL